MFIKPVDLNSFIISTSKLWHACFLLLDRKNSYCLVKVNFFQVYCLILLDLYYFHVNRQQQQQPPHIPHFVTNQQNQPLNHSPQLSFINNQAPEMSAPPYPNAAAITYPNPHHGATSPSGSESAMLSEVVKSNSTGEKVEAVQEVHMEDVVEVKHSRFRVRHSAG